MGKGRRYDQEYKDMIVDLFKSGMSLAELSSEYGIAKSTINGWTKDVKEIKVDEVIEFIDSNKSNHDIKTMCTVLGVARSTYYKSFDKTESARKLENDELKSAIEKIYTSSKGTYGAPRIYKVLCKDGFNVSIKRVQRRMTELGLCSVTVKKTNLIQVKMLQMV